MSGRRPTTPCVPVRLVAVLVGLLLAAAVTHGTAAAQLTAPSPTLSLEPAAATPGTQVRLDGERYWEDPDDTGGGGCTVIVDGQPAVGPTCRFEPGGRLVGSLVVPDTAPPRVMTVSVCRYSCPPGRAGTAELAVLAAPATVPDLVGDTLEEAGAALAQAGLALGEVSGEGVVVTQDPASGTQVDRGSPVSLEFAPVEQVEVPDLSGATAAQAATALKRVGLALGVLSGSGEVTSQRPEAGTRVDVGSAVDVTLEPTAVPSVEVPVPDLDGMTEKQASSALDAVGLALGPTTGAGRVSSQSPGAGRLVRRGTVVSAVLRQQAPVERVQVPDLARMTREEAAQALGASGLVLGEVSGEGRVATQRPAARALLDAGSSVAVSLAPLPVARVAVPDLTGSTREQAADELGALGLVLGVVTGQGQVTSQEPSPGTQVERGTQVRLDLAAVPPGGQPRPPTGSPSGTWLVLVVAAVLAAVAAPGLARRIREVLTPRVRIEPHLDERADVHLTELAGVSPPSASLRTRAGDDAPVLLEEVSR